MNNGMGFSTEEVVSILTALRDDPRLTYQFGVRVRQIADRNGKRWTEQQIQNVIARMVREYREAIDEKIQRIGG